MPVLVGLLALIGAAWLWMRRAHSATMMTRDLADAASDVMAAARRLGFRRRSNLHPVDCLDDADVAIAGAGIAFLELAGLPSAEQQDALLVSLQSHLSQPHDRAEEGVILGRWLVTECGGAGAGLTRLVRRLIKLRGPESFTPLMSVLNDVARAGRGTLSPKQGDALAEIQRLYRIH